MHGTVGGWDLSDGSHLSAVCFGDVKLHRAASIRAEQEPVAVRRNARMIMSDAGF